MFSIVAALQVKSLGIGHQGHLPWPKCSEDLSHFQRLTSHGVVIMGRKTYESLPDSMRPLPNRKNIVISRTLTDLPGAMVLSTLEDALAACNDTNVFVIGGGKLYRQAMDHPKCQCLYLTWMKDHSDCDTFFPALDGWTMMHSYPSKSTQIQQFCVYERSECQYLRLVRQILDNGQLRSDRTNTSTLSIFGASMRFSLRQNSIPILTTKRVFWRGIVEELMWFLRGSTDASELQNRNIHIWDAHGSREYLDSIGLESHDTNDLGPVYGFQWRHFGADYVDCHADYTNKGVDQIQECIRLIKEDPSSRRILFSAWNPPDLKRCALPPCHVLCQFYVANNELSCQMYQRSGDMGLGVPFNIASYALLTRLMAEVCGLQAGDFIHVIGDAHVYCNHIEALETQLLRQPQCFPKLRIQTKRTNLCDYVYDDFVLLDYCPDATIPMHVAI